MAQSRKYFFLVTVILLCMLAAGAYDADAGQRPITSGARQFQYLGAWHTNSSGRFTIYPGSQVRFMLRGAASLDMTAGAADSIRVIVRREGTQDGSVPVWDGIITNGLIALDGGTSNPALFTVIYAATRADGFDPAAAESAGAILTFNGLRPARGAAVSAPPDREGPVLHFVGDSITAGSVIHGRAGSWNEHSDATRSYAFLLAESLDARYSIRAFPGLGSRDAAARFPYFRKGVPLPPGEKPDFVLVNIGANERTRRESAYRKQMRDLVAAVTTTHPSARVVLLNFCRMTPDRFPVLQELARSYPGGLVTCFDARPFLTGYSDSGVHPDAASHAALADALKSVLSIPGPSSRPSGPSGP